MKIFKIVISWLTKSFDVGLSVVRFGMHFSLSELITILKNVIMIKINEVKNFVKNEYGTIFNSIVWSLALVEKCGTDNT